MEDTTIRWPSGVICSLCGDSARPLGREEDVLREATRFLIAARRRLQGDATIFESPAHRKERLWFADVSPEGIVRPPRRK